MGIELKISILALIISGLSFMFAWFTFVSNSYLKFTELKSNLLTKVSTLRIEYEKLHSDTIEALGNLEKIPTQIVIDGGFEENYKKFIQNTKKQVSHVSELLELTGQHYNNISTISFIPLGAIMLEKMRHHIEALNIQTKHDRNRFKEWSDQLQFLEKLTNDHKKETRNNLTSG